MGLAIYACDFEPIWQSSYSYFGQFRTALAEAAGIGHWDLTETNEYHLLGLWYQLPEEPLDIIFSHSDCDGFLLPFMCEALADRIEGLVSKLPEEFREGAGVFIEGLHRAFESGTLVEFA